MNKCNFCVHSIPTESIGAWKCNKEGNTLEREQECTKAICTMKEYNEIRAKIDTIKELF